MKISPCQRKVSSDISKAHSTNNRSHSKLLDWTCPLTKAMASLTQKTFSRSREYMLVFPTHIGVKNTLSISYLHTACRYHRPFVHLCWRNYLEDRDCKPESCFSHSKYLKRVDHSCMCLTMGCRHPKHCEVNKRTRM